MQNKLNLIIISTAITMLAGCTQPIDTPSSTVSVNSVNGTYPLSKTFPYQYVICNYDPTKMYDIRIVKALSSQKHTSNFYTYTSTDSSCSGSETHRYQIIYQISIDGETTASWDFSTVPNRADETGPLPDPVIVSKVQSVITEIYDYVPDDDFTISTSIGTELKRLVYIDDSGTSELVTVYADSLLSGTDESGYPLLMDPDPIFHPIK